MIGENFLKALCVMVIVAIGVGVGISGFQERPDCPAYKCGAFPPDECCPPVAETGNIHNPCECVPICECASPVIDNRTVIGLSGVLAEEHVRLQNTIRSLDETRAEARRIIQALLKEVQKLQKAPRIHPGNLTAENGGVGFDRTGQRDAAPGTRGRID